jgi:hypothetical protein
MSEYEILTLLADAHAEQTLIIGQIISLHLAIVVGVFYFLHRSGWAMKIAIAFLYSLGYALLLGLLLNLSAQILGGRHDLIALAEGGARLSGIGYQVLQQTAGRAENAVSLIGNFTLLVLWLGTLGFLFLWKRPKERN